MGRSFWFIWLILGVVPYTSTDYIDNSNGSVVIQIVFYEIKPYIFWDTKKHEWTGIFPMMFKKAAAYCTNSPQNNLAEYTIKFDSRVEMENAMHSEAVEGQGIFANLTSGRTAWLPYDTNVKKVGPHFLERHLAMHNILLSNKMVVIQPRERIELPNKLLRGFQSCDLIIIISVLLSFAFGMTVYIIERPYNPIFQDKMGLLTSLYWSFVTMTTVGYGDVVPVTLLGKAVSVVWMFFGLMVASVYTATLTNAVTGTHGLEIKGQNVSVVQDSHEEYFVERDYLAHPVLYKSHREAVNAVREGVVHSAVLPYDIAGWMQEEIRKDNENHKVPLSIVYTLDGKIPFNILTTSDKEFDVLLECMLYDFKGEVVTNTEDLYTRTVNIEETVFFDNPFEVFLRNLHVQVLSGLTILLLIVSLVFWHFGQKESRVSFKVKKRKTIEQNMAELSTLLVEYKELVKQDKLDLP